MKFGQLGRNFFFFSSVMFLSDQITGPISLEAG